MMHAKELMSIQPVCAPRSASLAEIAQLMVERDCGAIPIVEPDPAPRVIGMVTDRDIVTRAIAAGRDVARLSAADVMTSPILTATADESVERCGQLMMQHQVRRIVIVDDEGRCVGILAQADLARHVSPEATGEVVKQVSLSSQSGLA
jgi:CBS domain-containing protein